MTLQSRTFVIPFSPSCRDCSTPETLSRSIVPKMIDMGGRDFSRGTTSSPYTGRFFPEFATGFEVLALATPWSIPVPSINKFYSALVPPPHAPASGT